MLLLGTCTHTYLEHGKGLFFHGIKQMTCTAKSVKRHVCADIEQSDNSLLYPAQGSFAPFAIGTAFYAKTGQNDSMNRLNRVITGRNVLL